MPYKDDVLRELDVGFEGLQRSFDGLDEAEMTRVWLDEWSVKDILAHIAGWHREMAGSLRRLARGERATPEGVDYTDGTAWNAQFAQASRAVSPAAVVQELKNSFADFRDAARQVPEERFERGRTADRLVHTSGIDHYAEHAEQISAWRAASRA